MSEQTKPIDTKALRDALFVPLKDAAKRRGLKMLIWGPTYTAKTHIALSCPEPVYVISTEHGTTQLLQQFPNKDIRVMECAEAYTDAPVDAAGKVHDDPFEVDPVISLEKVAQATEALKDITEGTIVIDSLTDIWKWLGSWLQYNAKKKQSKTGGEYMMRTEWSIANDRYRWMIMRLLSRPCNVVVTSRSGNIYDAQGNMTSSTKADGQKQTPYFFDIIIHTTRSLAKDATGKPVPGGKMKRVAILEKVRHMDMDENLQIEDCTFDKLKEKLKGKVPAEVFGI